MSTLADVLAAHQIQTKWFGQHDGWWECTCEGGEFAIPWTPEHVAQMVTDAGLAVVPAGVVDDFIGERAQFITAIENCASDNTADYWRWQGHAEARRHLSERLAAAEQVSS